MEETLEQQCNRLRAQLKEIEKEIRGMRHHSEIQAEEQYAGQRGEMIAQSIIALRSVENARMRLGKVLQYNGDGTSIYDKH